MSIVEGIAACGIIGVLAMWRWTTAASGRVVRSDLPQGEAKNSLVMVTGASSGIGAEVATLFGSLNCHVLLVGRNEVSLKETADRCLHAGASSATISLCDVTKGDDIRNLLTTITQTVTEKNAVLTHVVLNAGVGAILPCVDTPTDAFVASARQLMEVNYFSNVQLLSLLLPILRCSQNSNNNNNNGKTQCVTTKRILVVSSLAGILPSTLRSGYTASKHALQGFINALRGELPSREVTITLSCPGYVETAFHSKAAAAAAATAMQNRNSSSTSPSSHRHGSMSAEECAQRSVKGMLRGESEIIMTTSGRVAYALRPWLPRMVDYFAAKKSFASVGLPMPH